jgi:hypothetical protein
VDREPRLNQRSERPWGIHKRKNAEITDKRERHCPGSVKCPKIIGRERDVKKHEDEQCYKQLRRSIRKF